MDNYGYEEESTRVFTKQFLEDEIYRTLGIIQIGKKEYLGICKNLVELYKDLHGKENPDILEVFTNSLDAI